MVLRHQATAFCMSIATPTSQPVQIRRGVVVWPWYIKMVSKSLLTSTRQFTPLSSFNWSISAPLAATLSSPTFIALLPRASHLSCWIRKPLTTLGIDAVNRLIICGDFNLPGNSPDTIDDELTELLHSTSFAQFVDAPTRYDTHHDKWSLLILSSHHRHLFWPHLFLSLAHTKSLIIPFYWQTSAPNGKNLLVGLSISNLKDIDLTSFQQTILASSLFTNPNPTVDGFEQQMENTITSILNDFAPHKTGHRSGPDRQRIGSLLKLLKLRNIGAGLSGAGKLLTPNQTALHTELHAAQPMNWSWNRVQHPILSASTAVPKIPNHSGQPLNPSFTHPPQQNNFHQQFLNLGWLSCFFLPREDCLSQTCHILQTWWPSISLCFWQIPLWTETQRLHTCHSSRGDEIAQLDV